MNAMMESEVLRLITNREIRSDVEAILIVRFLDVLVTHTTTTDDEAFSPGVNLILLVFNVFKKKKFKSSFKTNFFHFFFNSGWRSGLPRDHSQRPRRSRLHLLRRQVQLGQLRLPHHHLDLNGLTFH